MRHDGVPGLKRWLDDIDLRPRTSFAQRPLSVPAQLATAKCMRPEQVDEAYKVAISDGRLGISEETYVGRVALANSR